jgi:predicted O-methyltransferase YrrM
VQLLFYLVSEGGSVIIRGTQAEIMAECKRYEPRLPNIAEKVKGRVPAKKRQIAPFQGYALYMLTRMLEPERVVELGTFFGYSAAMMSEAAPEAHITTLNPKVWEYEVAVKCMAFYPMVKCLNKYSWDYMEELGSISFLDMVFVDGDHKQIYRDLPWWNLLKVGGLFFHHDWTPEDAEIRPCKPVYEALNDFGDFLGREPDVQVVDDKDLGMAGWYKREGDPDVEVVVTGWKIARG